MTFNYSQFYILHGEDDPADAEIMQRVLRDIQFDGDYKNLSRGQDFMAWSADKDKVLPGLIFLDIGLPGFNGKEILSALREDEGTSSVPIVMISGSSSLRDYGECIRLGANGYIQKMSDLGIFTQVCQNIIQGWAQLSSQKFF